MAERSTETLGEGICACFKTVQIPPSRGLVLLKRLRMSQAFIMMSALPTHDFFFLVLLKNMVRHNPGFKEFIRETFKRAREYSSFLLIQTIHMERKCLLASNSRAGAQGCTEDFGN